MAATLTLQRLGVTGTLYRTLRSTNAIEDLNGLVGHFVRNVRRWRDGAMLVRWIAAGLHERIDASDASAAAATCRRSSVRSIVTW